VCDAAAAPGNGSVIKFRSSARRDTQKTILASARELVWRLQQNAFAMLARALQGRANAGRACARLRG